MNLLSTLIFILATFTSLSCMGQSKAVPSDNSIPKTETKEPIPIKNLDTQINELKVSMLDYMKMGHPTYSPKDVETCSLILNQYIAAMLKSDSKEEGMQIVESTILQLNKLNKKCDGTLIETSEREKIAEIIISAGYQKGYNTMDEDITEAWREW